MAILFAEDFKGYGTQKDLLLNGLWGTSAFSGLDDDPDPTAPPDPVTGSRKVASCVGGFCQARRPFTKGNLSTAGVAFRMWLDALPGFTVHNMRMLDAGNGVQCAMAVTPTGVIQIWNGVIGHGGTLLGATAAPVTTATAWHHYEFKVVTSADHTVTTGSAEVRVDGVSVLSVQNVGTGPAAQIGLGNTDDYSNTAGVNCHYKDLVVWDDSGQHNNDFLGTVAVVSMWPDADVALNWTPSTGATGYNLIGEAPPTDNVDYITAPYPPPAPADFSLSDLPVTVSRVYGLISQVRARKNDGGDGKLQNGLLSNGAEIDGSNRPLTTAYTYYEDVFEVDPATGNPWTPASADNAQLKLNRTL